MAVKDPASRAIINELRRSEGPRSFEFLTRTALVVLAALIGWVWFELELLPLWLSAYYSAVAIEKLLLWYGPEDRPRTVFALLIATSFSVAAIFAALPVYLWTLSDPIWKMASLVLLVGGSLNVILLRARVWQIALAYFLPLGGSFFLIAAQMIGADPANAQAMAGMILAAFMTIYFGISVREVQRANRRMLATQANLLQAQKVEALATLTGGISHDFKNLLSVIQGNLELLVEAPNSAERDQFIREAMNATRRGADLTAQLGLYTRRASLAPVPVDPIDVVEDVENLVRHVLPPNIAFRTHKPSEMDEIIVDESALKSALINLIVNARDAIPTRGTISLETYKLQKSGKPGEKDHPKPMVVFEVSDTGTGIPPSDLPNVFDPFFSTKPDGVGTGLGLATVQGFAEGSGGQVDIESRPGRGTRVQLLLRA